jgi:hypothetical protein
MTRSPRAYSGSTGDTSMLHWIHSARLLPAFKRVAQGGLVVAWAMVAGCSPQPNPSSSLAKAKEIFQDSIREFQAEQKDVKRDFGAGRYTLLTFQGALKLAVDKDQEFAKVQAKWHDVQARITVLYDKFRGLVEGADKVYTELDSRAAAITDDQLRTRTQAELQASIERYAARLKVSKAGIDRLRAQATHVTDIMNSLEVRFTLEVVEAQLGSIFKEIDDTVQTVMAQLDELVQASRRFTTPTPTPGPTTS